MYSKDLERINYALSASWANRLLQSVYRFLAFFCVTSVALTGELGFANNNNPSSCTVCSAIPYINLDAIQKIESQGCAYPCIADNGKAFGVFQIHPGPVADWNLANPSQRFSHKDMLDPVSARLVADWYLNTRIVQLLRHFKIPVNELNAIACYNYGIGNVVKWHRAGAQFNKLPKTTQNYWNKYRRLN